jgi:DNA-binding transcriptional LysR family regulator
MKPTDLKQYQRRAAEFEPLARGTMHPRHIEMFQAILQTGTLTDAAVVLNISQPAATKLLQQAERRLGFALFVRIKGRLQLTPKGQLLKTHIEQIFAQLNDLQMLVFNIARAETRLLRIISSPTLAFGIIPKAITRLRQQLGKSSVELSTQHPPEMFKSILLRESDIGIGLQESVHPDLCSEPLCTGSLVVIAPQGTWDAREASMPMPASTLSDRDLVGISTADMLGRLLQAYLEQINPPPRVSIWVQTYQIARELVSDGEGYALVDPFMAGSSGSAIQIRPVEPDLPLTLYALYRKDAPPNSAQRSFLNSVRAVASETISAISPSALALRGGAA